MRAALLCLLLSACCAPPTIIKEPFEVRVPVAVPCKPQAVAVPEWATDKVGVGHIERLRAMAVELAQRIAYEIELRAAIDGCAGKQP